MGLLKSILTAFGCGSDHSKTSSPTTPSTRPANGANPKSYPAGHNAGHSTGHNSNNTSTLRPVTSKTKTKLSKGYKSTVATKSASQSKASLHPAGSNLSPGNSRAASISRNNSQCNLSELPLEYVNPDALRETGNDKRETKIMGRKSSYSVGSLSPDDQSQAVQAAETPATQNHHLMPNVGDLNLGVNEHNISISSSANSSISNVSHESSLGDDHQQHDSDDGNGNAAGANADAGQFNDFNGLSFVGGPLLPALAPELKGRKCLVLDLDETLVHSSFNYVSDADFVIPVEIEGRKHNVFVVKRPHVDEFLMRVCEIYEVVVFTASVAKYGDPLLDILDPQGLIHHRLFRESCMAYGGSYVKNLVHLGRPLREVIIIDNSPASYALQPQHAVPVSSWFSDIHDSELLDMLPFLIDLGGPKVNDVSVVLDVSLPVPYPANSLEVSKSPGFDENSVSDTDSDPNSNSNSYSDSEIADISNRTNPDIDQGTPTLEITATNN